MCVDTTSWGRIKISQSQSTKKVHFDSEKLIRKTTIALIPQTLSV